MAIQQGVFDLLLEVFGKFIVAVQLLGITVRGGFQVLYLYGCYTAP